MGKISEKYMEIKGLCDRLSENDRSFFDEPMKEEEISAWEEEKKVEIPVQYKEWLMKSRKCDILGTVASFYLPRESEFIPEGYMKIGDLMGDGEKLCISNDGKRLVSFDHGEEDEYEEFADVLDLIIEILQMEAEDND